MKTRRKNPHLSRHKIDGWFLLSLLRKQREIERHQNGKEEVQLLASRRKKGKHLLS